MGYLPKTQANLQRLDCSICNYRIESNNEPIFAEFSCNVEAFKDEKFKVWRCPNCKTIHCLDVVNIDDYYAQYPIAEARLTWPHRLMYKLILRQLKKYNFSKTHSLLDYGCGVNGIFVQYLRELGFTNCYGYDPYAPKDGFGDLATLQRKPFDYIVIQDVIEHVEDPNLLLSELNSLLAPGGYILIGTPNAAKIDLDQPEVSDYYNSIHAPYHFHLYTRETLELLGYHQGWKPVNFFDRSYSDTLWFGLNARAWNQYQRLFGRSMDSLYQPIKFGRLLTSYKFLFYAMFGYWLSFRTDMAIMFYKRVE